MSSGASGPGRSPFVFRRVRDFSECVSDGFQFIREHRRTLYRPLLFICVPLKVVASVLLGAFFRSLVPAQAPRDTPFISMFLGYALAVTAFFLASVIVCEYMRGVMLEGRPPARATLWREVRRQAPAYFAVGLLSALILGASVFVFVLPFIFLLVVFQFSYPLRAFERTTVGDSIGRAFGLVWGRWWLTASLFFTLVVLSVLLNAVVDVPGFLLGSFGSLSGMESDPDSIGTRVSILFTLMTLVSSVTYMLLMPFLQVPMALHMLSVLERKEAPGLRDTVHRFSIEGRP